MILYIRELDDAIHYYGYASYEPKMAKSAGFRESVCSNIGYVDKSFIRDSEDGSIERVSPTKYFAGSSTSINTVMKAIRDLGFDIDVSYIPDNGPVSYYLKFGSSFDGLSDDSISDQNLVKVLKEKNKPYIDEIMSSTIYEELVHMFDKDKKDVQWVFDDPKYWDPKVNKPTFLIGNKIVFFPNLKTYKGYHLYLATNVKESDEIGKQLKSVNYTIMLCPEIEEITSLVNKLDLSLSQPIVIKSDVLYNKSVLRNIKYGRLVLKRYCGAIEVTAPNGQVLAILYSPPGLMMILRDDIRSTLSIFDKADSKIITDKIYTDGKFNAKLENKFILKDELSGASVMLHSGIDTLDRNLFKRLEKKNPCVSLFHLDGPKAIKYYTSIEIENEIAISYSPFNNLSFKK